MVFLLKKIIHLFATLFFPFFLLDFGKSAFKLFVLAAVYDNNLSYLFPLKPILIIKILANLMTYIRY